MERLPKGDEQGRPPKTMVYPTVSALAGAALRVLELRLAHLHLLTLGFADEERAAADIFRLVQFVVCQFLNSPNLVRIELSL